MKIPFYTVLGPLLKRNQRSIRHFCSFPFFNYCKLYVGALGVLGVLLSIFDIVRIIKCGPTLPGYLYRERLKEGEVVSPQAERDCKLICLVLSTEYYFFLIIGLCTGNPIFFLPFLSLYAFILAIEFLIFFIKLMTRHNDCEKTGLAMSLFMTYNWMSVFCTLSKITTGCDI